MSNPKKSAGSKPGERTPDEKLRLVIESAALPEDDLGAFLRREGVHEADLESWRAEALTGLAPTRKSSTETKRIRSLEKELNRKDKALAEMAALIALQKKARAIWGDEDDDTPTKSET